MQLKKLLQGTVFAAALAVCTMIGAVYADAATGEFADAKVSVSKVEKAEMSLTGQGTKEILVGVAKVAKTGKVTVSSWDVYEGTNATVDLSKLSNVKDNYIAIKGDNAVNDIPAIVKIPSADKAISAKYTPGTESGDKKDVAVLKIGTGAKASDAKSNAAEVTAAGSFEYRTAYSSAWKDIASETAADKLNLTKYQNQGATIYVRAMEKTVKEAPSAQGKEKVSYEGTEYVAYELDAKLPGKEAKVNIPARAKGPAVSADYTKATVKLPKNSEYRLVTSTIPAANTANATAATKTVAELLGESNATGWLEVRTAPQKDKKAASKWTRLNLIKPAELAAANIKAGDAPKTTTATPETTAKGEKVEYGGDGVAKAEVKEGASGSEKNIMDISYKPSGKAYVLTMKNNGDKTYEVTITAQKTTKPADTAKATKIAPGKTVTLKGIQDNNYVFIRVAGDKRTKTWVGAFTGLGVIDVPKVIVGTKEATS